MCVVCVCGVCVCVWCVWCVCVWCVRSQNPDHRHHHHYDFTYCDLMIITVMSSSSPSRTSSCGLFRAPKAALRLYLSSRVVSRAGKLIHSNIPHLLFRNFRISVIFCHFVTASSPLSHFLSLDVRLVIAAADPPTPRSPDPPTPCRHGGRRLDRFSHRALYSASRLARTVPVVAPSRHVTSRHVTSRHVTSRHPTTYGLPSFRPRIASHRTVPPV